MAQDHATRFKGSCFCGAITFSVVPNPILRAYCHCTNCQRLTGSPFIHTAHFAASDFEWTHSGGASALDTYVLDDKPYKTRYRCKTCGVCVASHNSIKEKWSLWAALFSRDKDGMIEREVWDVIKPDAHIFYSTRILDVNDELEKWEGYQNESKRLE